jgi:hypothetical protein
LLPAQPGFIKCGVEIIIVGSIIATNWQQFIKLPNELIFCEKAEASRSPGEQELQADMADMVAP